MDLRQKSSLNQHQPSKSSAHLHSNAVGVDDVHVRQALVRLHGGHCPSGCEAVGPRRAGLHSCARRLHLAQRKQNDARAVLPNVCTTHLQRLLHWRVVINILPAHTTLRQHAPQLSHVSGGGAQRDGQRCHVACRTGEGAGQSWDLKGADWVLRKEDGWLPAWFAEGIQCGTTHTGLAAGSSALPAPAP